MAKMIPRRVARKILRQEIEEGLCIHQAQSNSTTCIPESDVLRVAWADNLFELEPAQILHTEFCETCQRNLSNTGARVSFEYLDWGL
ncbi:MAG: hypothetical protein RLZZ347_255 [Candidatus Parcubacteria bacterium]|jgi:hypothetical protein